MNLRLPRTVRSIGRVQTIARVLTHHGFGHLVDKLNLRRFAPIPRWGHRPITVEEAGEPTLGSRLRRVCEELGPTFIKLGQMISSRPDLFPPEIVKELSKLQDRVPPFPTDQARNLIIADLGTSIEDCFETFEDEPFASGSIAQVYRALTKAVDGLPGKKVVVKVKRPNIEDIVRMDIIILRWLADLVENWVPELAALKPHTIVDEFERTIFREMDFVNEAATVSRFGELFKDEPDFRIPRVFWDFSGLWVLTLEELEGISARELLNTSDPRIDRHALAVRLIEIFLKQFFEFGLFHADPHPGNLLIQPPCTIGLIDFGLTGQVDDELAGHLIVALYAAFKREVDIVIEVLADMGCLGEATNRRQLRMDFLQLIEKYYGLPLERFDPQTLFFEVTGLLRRHDVTMPREFVLLAKALVSIGGLCLQLSPTLDLAGLTQPKLQRLVLNRLSPPRLLKSLGLSGWNLMNLLKNAPSQLRDVARQLARGHWQVTIRHRNLDDLANEIDRASNRLGFAVIIGSIIVGSSWILSSESKLTFLKIPLPVFGVIGYLVAGVMGLWLVVAILRSGKLS